MSLGLSYRKEAQKRRSKRFWSIFKLLTMLGLCVAVGYYAYQAGNTIANEDAFVWKTRYESKVVENEQLTNELGKDKATVDQLSQLLPNQEIRDLLSVVTEKANSGIEISRMTTVIQGITKDATCASETETKRFMVMTPVSPDDTTTASFYRGLITLTGRGSPTINEEGNPQAWFDTTKEITIDFILPGGDKQEVSGTLPLYHSVIINDDEYRFSIIAGRISFVDASVQKCGI